MSEQPHADDDLDGCEVNMSADPVSDRDLAYVVLSPEGDPRKLEEYRKLFPEVADGPPALDR